MQEYPLIAETGRIEGIPALDEGNFDKAYQLLSAAKTAVDSLGGAVEGADEIRTAAAEAAIFVDLSPQLLEDMLEEAGRTDPTSGRPGSRPSIKGRTILIDSIITDEPGPGLSSRYTHRIRGFPAGRNQQFQRGEGCSARSVSV